MTPIGFLLEHRKAVLNAYDGSPVEAWRKLVERIQIDKSMTENTFRTILKPFAETCKFFGSQLNKLNETIIGLNDKLNNEQELNLGLNNQVKELNNRLNELDGLNAELNNELVKFRLNTSDDVELNKFDEGLNVIDKQVKSKLNISGWTVAKSGRYFRAFKKIKGRVYGVHLGKDLTDAENKILAKQLRLRGCE